MEEVFILAAEFIGVLIEFVFSPKKRSGRRAVRKQFPQRKRILQDSRVKKRGKTSY